MPSMEDPECMPLVAISPTSQESKVMHYNNRISQSETHLSESSLQRNSDDSRERASRAFDKSGRSCVESSTSLVSSNSPLDDQLVKAVKDGDDIIKIESLLQAKASPNAVDDSSYLSCAQIATNSGRADILRLLFEYDADPKVVKDRKTLLHLTIEKQDLNCLKVIIQTDIDINQVDNQEESVLYAAVNAKWIDGVCELLNHRPDMEGRYGKNKKTVLQQAVAKKNNDLVKSIVSHARCYDNFDKIVNVKNSDGMTPLFIAVLENNHELLKILLAAQPDVMLLDKFKRNVLHWAAEKGHSQIMEDLFKQRPSEMNRLAEQVCEGKVQGTPLHIAISRGSDKCVKYLIEQAKVSLSYKTDVADHKNCNILHIVSYTDKSDVLKYFTSLLNRTKDKDHNLLSKLVYEPTKKGETPLHFALRRRQIDYIYALIAAGSDLTAKCVDKSNYRTAIDILIYQVPSAVEILNKVFDKSIQRNKNSTSVMVDYKVLMSEAERENKSIPSQSQTGEASGNKADFKGDRFGVIKALQRTGDRLGQKKLLEHPLVESFVHLHWKRLEGPYFMLAALNVLYSLSLSLFVLLRLTLADNLEVQWTFGAFMISCMVPLLIHELECFKESQPWGYRAEGILKFACFALSVCICFPGTAREISAFAVLIAWFEVVLLISRIPYYGHYMLMFIEIAFKYSKLLLSFVFVLFGFVVAFMIIFGLQKPFNIFWLAVVKIIVMMTNELEYDSFNENFNETIPSTFSRILAMGVYILFVIFISLVLTNLFVAVAVEDIKKLHIVSKQASFLGVYDAFLLAKPTQKSSRGTMYLLFLGGCTLVRLFSKKLVKRRKHFGQVKSLIEIDVLINEEVAGFPEEISSALIQKGYENREKTLKELSKKKEKRQEFKEMLSEFEHTITAKLVGLSEQVSAIGASNKS